MDRIKETIERIKPLDEEAMEAVKARQDTLTKPQRSLGVLEDLSVRIAGITRNYMPEIKDKVIITMAGDHGVADEGVSAYPKEVTPQMVYNFLSGGAAINVLARHVGARVVVVDMGIAADIEVRSRGEKFVEKKIAYGTANMTKVPAMSYEDATRSLEAGIEVLESEMANGVDIVGVGDMGIGNTTPSSAIAAFITCEPVEKVTGRGTGLDDEGLKRKIERIQKALELNKPGREDAVDILAKLGGFEIGGMAGVMLAGASHRIPVVVDGFISGAAALLACELSPKVKDYLIASHLSVESGHRAILDHIGLEPLFNLNMRLGEGTGAALGICVVEASCKILREMATFEEAGVSEKE
ncbi:MAG: nicotinate-nucleotide--dimethylbenzimidazole phosphoribosyltransferase [Halobacteriota archaeon]